jgi:hypothetical protein
MPPSEDFLMLKEVDLLQANIARFDQNGLAIKTWSITLWSALMAYAYTHHSIVVAVGAVLPVLGFAFIELTYRAYQIRFLTRMGAVENALNGGENYVFGVDRAARTPSHDKEKPGPVVPPTRREYMTAMRSMHVHVLYLMQGIGCIPVAWIAWSQQT